MHEEQPSTVELKDWESKLELSLGLDQDGQPVARLDSYLAAKHNLVTVLDSAMSGQAGPRLAVDQTLEKLIDASTDNFAAVVDAEPTIAAKSVYATELFHQAAVEVQVLASKYGLQDDTDIVSLDELKANFAEALQADDHTSSHDILKSSLTSMYYRQSSCLLQYAVDSPADIKQRNRQRRIDQAKLIGRATARTAATAALGATVFAVVNRLIDRK